MGTFGERLQREREMRGITLEEIAESTKIGTRSLRALEEEDFEKLPGGIFNKGFVRAYARYLGIDEEQAVADYVAAFGDRGEPPLPAAPEMERPAPSGLGGRWVVAAVLLLVLGAAGWKLYPRLRAWRTPAPAPAVPAAPATQTPVVPVPADSAQAAPELTVVADAASGSAAQDGIVVRISAREVSWISIAADDQPAAEATLTPLSEKTVKARSRLVLKIGNVRGVELSYNGKPVPAPQSASNVATLTFTPEGVER